MSNIGFIESCAREVKKIFNDVVMPAEEGHRRKAMTKTLINEYIQLLKDIDVMQRNDEIEDMERFKIAYQTIIECDFRKVEEARKRIETA